MTRERLRHGLSASGTVSVPRPASGPGLKNWQRYLAEALGAFAIVTKGMATITSIPQVAYWGE